MSDAADRLLADATTVDLPDLDLPADSVVDGSPAAALAELTRVGASEIGVWELSTGTVTDTEADEVFVVVQGRGSVAFSDGSRITLSPGVVVRLHDGDRTTWTVTETIRKVYAAAV